MDSLIVSVIFTNIKIYKYNFLLVKVMNIIGTKIKYFCIKRHIITVIRQCSQHIRISKMQKCNIY